MDTPFTFGYPYRWSQILELDLDRQIACLEERDRALEAFFFSNGSCPLEIPYRWEQVLPGLLEGDPGAIACLEENDRAIEDLFNHCECGPPVVLDGLLQTGGLLFSGPVGYHDVLGTGFGSFILPDETLDNPTFEYGTSGTIPSPGTCSLYRLSGASEVLVHQFSVPTGTGVDDIVTLSGSFASGTSFRMRLSGVESDEIFGAQFRYQTEGTAVNSLHEWAHD